MKINIKNFLFYFVGILLFHSSIMKYNYVENYNYVSLFLGCVVTFYLLLNINKILKKKYNKINLLILILSIIAIFSSMINDFMNFDGTVLFILKFVNLFFYFELADYKNITNNTIKIFFFLIMFYLLYNMYIVVKVPFIAYNHNLTYPFFSTKFSLSYYGLISAALYKYLYCSNNKNSFAKKLIGIIIFFFSFWISNKVGCTTGLIGTTILFILYTFSLEPIKKIISNRKYVFFTILIVSFCLVAFFDLIMNIPFVSNLVQNGFNKSLTLSGRKVVYEKIFSFLLSAKGLTFGYSYNGVRNAFGKEMYISQNHFALDAQNSLFEIWMYFGLFGAIIMIGIILSVFKKNEKTLTKKNFTLYVAVYVLIILGMVEITYSFPLFLLLAILNVTKNSENC